MNKSRIVETLSSKPYALIGAKAITVPLDGVTFNANTASDIVTGRTPVIYADEIAEYLESENSCIQTMNETLRPMPCFDTLWIEGCPWRPDEASKLDQTAFFTSVGGLVQLVKLWEPANADKAKVAKDSMIESGHQPINDDPEPHCAVRVFVYATGVNGEVYGPMAVATYFLNAQYEVLKRKRVTGEDSEGTDLVPISFVSPLAVPPLLAGAGVSPAFIERMGVEGARAFERSFLFATSKLVMSLCARVMGLLNCSNVQMVPEGKVENANPPRKARRAGLAWIKYHVLKVKVGKQLVPVQPRRADVTGRGVPLHQVRGSFRDYAKNGLFGRYKGDKYAAVWCPPYVKGVAEAGAVVKDYRLSPAVEELDRAELSR